MRREGLHRAGRGRGVVEETVTHDTAQAVLELRVGEGVDEGVVHRRTLGEDAGNHACERRDGGAVTEGADEGDGGVGQPGDQVDEQHHTAHLGDTQLDVGLRVAPQQVDGRVHARRLAVKGPLMPDDLHPENGVGREDDDARHHEAPYKQAEEEGTRLGRPTQVVEAASRAEALLGVATPAGQRRSRPHGAVDPDDDGQARHPDRPEQRVEAVLDDGAHPVDGDDGHGADGGQPRQAHDEGVHLAHWAEAETNKY